jgi:hypothetical protein
MSRHAACVTFAALLAFIVAPVRASTPIATTAGAKTSAPAAQTEAPKFASAAAPDPRPSNPRHLFTVTDEKGLVLTCVAPEIETNANTDLFQNCTLAPGRSLEDVMHTFIRCIHYEQSQRQKEREDWLKDLEEMSAKKTAPEK